MVQMVFFTEGNHFCSDAALNRSNVNAELPTTSDGAIDEVEQRELPEQIKRT